MTHIELAVLAQLAKLFI